MPQKYCVHGYPNCCKNLDKDRYIKDLEAQAAELRETKERWRSHAMLLVVQVEALRKVMKDYVQLREDTQVTGREYLSRKKSIEKEIYKLAKDGE